MTGQSQRQVVGGDTAAIVADPQQFHATLLDFHVDAPGTGVEAVLQQLLDDRRRAFDHLTGGDLVRQPRAEQLDPCAIGHCWDARAVVGICRLWPTFNSSVLRLLAERRLATLT
ncbi:hypothetical protein D3C80_1509340 [compost metagenome]